MPWLPHLLALLAIGPALAGRWLFAPGRAGRSGAYRRIVAWQGGAGAAILLGAGPAAVWIAPAGFGRPPAGWLAAIAAALFLSWTIRGALRSGGADRGSASGFWPRTPGERAGWALVAVASGIGEEIMFRGYLLRYFHVLPWRLDAGSAIALSCLLFGLGHGYQGAAAGARAAAAGLFFFGLFLGSGSLLLPAAVHVAGDLAGLLSGVLRRRR